jgi:predicted nucleic acid-binding protein
MYLVGAPHRERERIAAFLRAHADEPYVTSAEVYQEIVHRYVAIDRRRAIADAFALLDALVERVLSIHEAHARRAHDIALTHRRLSGRDCLHVATMEAFGITRILSADRGFDLWPGLERLPR